MAAIDSVTEDLIIITNLQVMWSAGCSGLRWAVISNHREYRLYGRLDKDLFDRCYNEWLGTTDGLPTAVYIRAGLDGTATSRAISQIAGGLSWRLIRPPLY